MILEFPGPAGRIEALLDDSLCDLPGDASSGAPDVPALKGRAVDLPRVAVVLGHPLPTAGGTMHTKVVYQIAKGLCRSCAAVLRFNFRGTGMSQGRFDGGPGEMEDFRAALDFMAARYPDVELWAAGFSFGSWIAMTVGATDDRVSTLVGVAPPVTQYDFTAVLESLKPKFFIHGERDEISPLRAMREFYGRVPDPKELVVIDGADHLFDGKTAEVADTVEELLGDWSGLGSAR
jgi:alpha/beta superfamily hydrolase